MLENDTNRNDYVFEPYEFTDEVSATVTYIGLSGQGDGAVSLWRIKKILTTGNITIIQYPDGDQSLTYVWNARAGYTYS